MLGIMGYYDITPTTAEIGYRLEVTERLESCQRLGLGGFGREGRAADRAEKDCSRDRHDQADRQHGAGDGEDQAHAIGLGNQAEHKRRKALPPRLEAVE